MLDLKLPSGKGYKYTLETSDGDLRFSDVPYERLVEAEKLSQLKEKAAGKTITLKAKGNKRKKWVITIEDEYNDDWIRKLPDYDDVEVTEAAMDLRSSSVGED